MGIAALGHIYAETAHWDASVGFWEGLGFQFAERWGSEGHRAGRLSCGQATVVLAEVADSPQFNVFFDLEHADAFVPGAEVTVSRELEDTHWGTRWIQVTDPDGRTYSLEET